MFSSACSATLWHGRRTLALACALAALPLAALAGCAGSGPPPAADVAAVTVPAGPAPASVARYRWSTLASSPLGARSGPLVVWGGGRLLEFGGLVRGGTEATSAGASFDPVTGRWRRVAPVPGAAGLSTANPLALTSAWTGRYLAVADGRVGSCPKTAADCWTGAALYDPAANRWTALTLPRQLDGLSMSAVAWTGREIVVGATDTAAFGTSTGRLSVAAYTPATRRWRVITPAVPRRHPARYLDLVYADGRVLLWSFWDRVARTRDGFSDAAGVDILAMNSKGAWRNITGSWPQQKDMTAVVLTGDGILVSPGQIWCGVDCSPPYAAGNGYLTNPVTLARKTIPLGPIGEVNPAFVWDGDAVIAIDLDGGVSGAGINIQPGDMALFDPATRRWTRLPATPGRPTSLSVTPVWSGTELLSLTDAGRLLAFHR